MTVYMVYLIFTLQIAVLAIVVTYLVNSIISRNFNRKRQLVMKERVFSIAERHISSEDSSCISEEDIIDMRKLISGRSGMKAFIMYHKMYIEKYGRDEKIRSYVERVVSYRMLLNNNIVRDRYRRSYVLYLMAEFHMYSDEIRNFAVESLEDRSLYARNNALRIASNSRNEDFFSEALSVIDATSRYYNEKVIIDAIDNFTGNSEKLDNVLIKNISGYKSRLKCILVEHFTNSKNGEKEVKEVVASFLDNEDKELVIAATKYFNEVYDRSARNCILRNIDSSSWEIRAVSARVLGKYGDNEVFEKLMGKISDSNWYVRFNGAFSLLDISNYEEVLEYVFDDDDRYAREIVIYAAFVKGYIDFERYQQLGGIEKEAIS